jgi:hypothetical protein
METPTQPTRRPRRVGTNYERESSALLLVALLTALAGLALLLLTRLRLPALLLLPRDLLAATLLLTGLLVGALILLRILIGIIHLSTSLVKIQQYAANHGYAGCKP